MHYSIPPTMPTRNIVLQRTLRVSPLHGVANARKPRTSSRSLSRSDGDDVTMMKDSSVSRFEERELRLVEPKSVRTGAASGVGDSQIPLWNKSKFTSLNFRY